MSNYPDENEYDENQDYDQQDYSSESEELNESLGEIIGSYDENAISYEALEGITNKLHERIEYIKISEMPPIEEEIDSINYDIEKKRVELEKVKKSSVFVNDMSEDVEFHYNEHHIKHVEDDIKDYLNKRYTHEKARFKFLEELEELESRYTVCTKLIDSYELRAKVTELADYSNAVVDELNFYIDSYSSVTEPEMETIEIWENNWTVIVEVVGRCNMYRMKLKDLWEYLDDVKKHLEEKDPESKFVFDEIPKYAEIEEMIQDLVASHEDNLFTSMAAIYELGINYEVGEDYLPENRVGAIAKINKLKTILLNIKTTMDNYKLEYKDFRKSMNNIFVVLNKAFQAIESQQKILKNQQESRIKKMRDIYAHITKSTLETLRNSTTELNNAINNLSNLGATSYQVEAFQYYFSLKANYPVDESAREDIVEGLNGELYNMNIMEIDIMTKILEAKYDPKSGLYIDTQEITIKPTPQKPISNVATTAQTGRISEPKTEAKGKTGNLDFLGNMYLKEAQRLKGDLAAKSYLKAIDTFIKCAELEEDSTKKITFLKMALKSAKDALVEKESSETFHAYAIAYRELANNHSGKISAQGYLKIGDHFVAAAKMFLREENIVSAKEDFQSAYEVYKIALPSEDAKLKIAAVQRFLK